MRIMSQENRDEESFRRGRQYVFLNFCTSQLVSNLELEEQ
jgi:hypothetical protein